MPECGAVLQVPASLAPASLPGDSPPPTVPGGGPVHRSGMGERPVADIIPPTPTPDIFLGSPAAGRRSRPDDEMEVTAPNALPAPPSIRMPAGSRPAPPPEDRKPAARAELRSVSDQADPVPRRTTRRPSLMDVPTANPDDAAGWLRVKSGLAWVQWGVLLGFLPFLALFGKFILYTFDGDQLLKPRAGYLDAGLNFWDEIVLESFVGFSALGGLLILVGRRKCLGVPPAALAKGLAGWSFVFTLLSFLASLTVCAGYALNFKYGPAQYPPEIWKVGLVAFVGFSLLAWTYAALFLGQVGRPLGRPEVQREVGGVVLTILFLPLAAAVVNEFYPVFEPSAEEQTITRKNELIKLLSEEAARDRSKDTAKPAAITLKALADAVREANSLPVPTLGDVLQKKLERQLMMTGGLLVVAFLYVLRFNGAMGSVRRGVRKWVRDHAPHLAA